MCQEADKGRGDQSYQAIVTQSEWAYVYLSACAPVVFEDLELFRAKGVRVFSESCCLLFRVLSPMIADQA